MTRAELELVQGLGDPLTLADFLPREPVAKGRTWKLPESAVVSLTGYDAVKSSTMEATLEQLDEAAARVRLKGEVKVLRWVARGRSHVRAFSISIARRGWLIGSK